MIKQMVFAVALASAPNPVIAQEWRAEHTRLATAKTINRLAEHCRVLGFDRAVPLDDSAVAGKIFNYLSVVPNPEAVFAQWSQVPERLEAYKQNVIRPDSERMGDALDAAVSDPSSSSLERAEEIYAQSFMLILTIGLEECETGVKDPFLSKFWSGTASLIFESLAKSLARQLVNALLTAKRQQSRETDERASTGRGD